MEGCIVTTNESGMELNQHGDSYFPMQAYHDNLLGHEVAWHWHKELEIGVITEGTARIGLPNQTVDLHEGEGFFIGTEIIHNVIPVSMDRCELESIVFHPSIVDGEPESVFHQKYVLPLMDNSRFFFLKLTPQTHSDILQLLRSALSLFSAKENGYELLERNCLSQILFDIQFSSTPQPPHANIRSKELYRLKQMLDYIDLHYSQDIRLKDLAVHANISESEVLRAFRKVMGITPFQHITQHRLNHAASLLLSTDDKVANIAEKSGFSDVSYFTKVFREKYGLPPAQYRKQF